MSWKLLPVDYTDAVWSGLRKYIEINNEDDTVSFQDVTQYSNKENSFFGALDANRMNEALNTIMSMVENGTDLYEAFRIYFETQKGLFTDAASKEYNDLMAYIDKLEAQGDQVIEDIKTDYRQEMDTYENEQQKLFDIWFSTIRGQLSQDAAGNLQTQIDELNFNDAAQDTTLTALALKNSEQDTAIAGLETDIAALEQATATKQSGFYSAVHSRSGTVHNLIVQNPPTDGAYTVRFTATAQFVEGDSISLNGNTLTASLTNAEPLPDKLFVAGAVVCTEISGAKAFFRAGGMGYNDELPVQPRYGVNIGVESGVATVVPESVERAHAGNLFVYKRGETAPSSPKDGTVVDLGKANATDIAGLENDVKYTGRLFAYNSKKQFQTIYNEKSFYPSDYAPAFYRYEHTGSSSTYGTRLDSLEIPTARTVIWSVFLLGVLDSDTYRPWDILSIDCHGNVWMVLRPKIASPYSVNLAKINPQGEILLNKTLGPFANCTEVFAHYGEDDAIYISTRSSPVRVYKYTTETLDLISEVELQGSSSSVYTSSDRKFTYWGTRSTVVFANYLGDLYTWSGGYDRYSLNQYTEFGEPTFSINDAQVGSISSIGSAPIHATDGSGFALITKQNEISWYSLGGELRATHSLGLPSTIVGITQVCGQKNADSVMLPIIISIVGKKYTYKYIIGSVSEKGWVVQNEWDWVSEGSTAPMGYSRFINDYDSQFYIAAGAALWGARPGIDFKRVGTVPVPYAQTAVY